METANKTRVKGPEPTMNDIPVWTQFNVRMELGLHKAINAEARRTGLRKQDVILAAMHSYMREHPDSPNAELLPSDPSKQNNEGDQPVAQ